MEGFSLLDDLEMKDNDFQVSDELVPIKTMKLEDLVETTYSSVLSLDVSLRSSGVTIFQDGKFSHYLIKTEGDLDAAFYYYDIFKALRDDLISLIEGQHFDLIAIEEVVYGINGQTNRQLAILNMVIDSLIVEGIVSCSNFKRMKDVVWKKHFRGLREGKKVLKDKIEIRSILVGMKFEMALDSEHLSQSAIESKGYQDIFDSVGLLIGAVLSNYDNTCKKLSKRKQSKLNVRVVKDISELGSRLLNQRVVKDEDFFSSQTMIEPFMEQIDLSGTDEDKYGSIYLIKVSTLGSFGRKHGLFDDVGVTTVALWLTKK